MQADTKISAAPEAVNVANAFTGMLNRGLAGNRYACYFLRNYITEKMRWESNRPTIIRESAMLIASCSHVCALLLIRIIYGGVEDAKNV